MRRERGARKVLRGKARFRFVIVGVLLFTLGGVVVLRTLALGVFGAFDAGVSVLPRSSAASLFIVASVISLSGFLAEALDDLDALVVMNSPSLLLDGFSLSISVATPSMGVWSCLFTVAVVYALGVDVLAGTSTVGLISGLTIVS